VELENVILKMLEKKPADRFDSMQEVGAAMRGLKCFIEDPVELNERMLRKDKEEQTMSIDKRLDSRADADRTAKGITTPVAKKKKRKPTAAMLLEEQKRKEQQPAPAEPAAPIMQPMQYPTPGHYYPGQPMPGQPMPGQPMPGQVYPGQLMPAQPYPVPQAMPLVAGGQQPVPTQAATAPVSALQQNTPPIPVQPAATAPQPPVDQDAPQDATESDVQGLMDTIE
jgi:hypothetical protein